MFIDELSPDLTAPAVLAYLGDAVYELFVRERFIRADNMTVAKLNKAVQQLVNAKGQCQVFGLIRPLLTEEEIRIFKRGRNVGNVSPPKNCKIHQYRIATGLEALIGYLYLKDKDRLEEIFCHISRLT